MNENDDNQPNFNVYMKKKWVSFVRARENETKLQFNDTSGINTENDLHHVFLFFFQPRF